MRSIKPKFSKTQNRGDGLMALADPVDDNLYLASASRAAIADKESGAYDEYLFSEDGHREMPFEQALASHSNLLSSRIGEYGRREIETRHRRILICKAKISMLAAELRQLGDRLKIINEDLGRQRDILDGHEKGDHEMYWTDSIPHIASTFSAKLRLWSHGLTFLVVAAIDFGILRLSFQSLPGFNEGYEAYLLTLPALGIQVVFPHLLGERLGFILRGHPRKKQNRTELVLLAVGWIMFILVITVIRINFINNQGGKTASKQDQMQELAPAITGLSLLMLVGLGAWMILLASRRNPHKNEFVRLLLAKQSLVKDISKAEIELLATQGNLPPLELALQATHESFQDAVSVAKAEMSEAARMVYRRALINTMGHVEFTKSYLEPNVDSFNLSEPVERLEIDQTHV